MRTALRRCRRGAPQEPAPSGSPRQPAPAADTSPEAAVAQVTAAAARQWLNTPMVPAVPQPRPTAVRSGGLITPVQVPSAALPAPAGTIATRCLRCGSTRLHYPGVNLDLWRGHPDRCAPRSAAVGGSPAW